MKLNKKDLLDIISKSDLQWCDMTNSAQGDPNTTYYLYIHAPDILRLEWRKLIDDNVKSFKMKLKIKKFLESTK